MEGRRWTRRDVRVISEGGARRRLRVVVLVGVAAIVFAIPPTSLAGAPPDPFAGSYRSIDFDGSSQSIAFGGPVSGPNGGYRAVVYQDDVGTVCGGDRAFARGIGSVDGDTLWSFVEVSCGNVANVIGVDVVGYTVGSAPGTLVDTYGNTWSRP